MDLSKAEKTLSKLEENSEKVAEVTKSVQKFEKISEKLQNLPEDIKKKISDDSNFGIHLHCPEASTPKDGPSAGGALTLAVVSLFTQINVKNTIGLTGEIDIKGNITKIGGLDLKIDGGKYAGLKTIIVPMENKNDYDLIKKNNPHILEDIEIIFVSHIKEIIELALEDNELEFNFDL